MPFKRKVNKWQQMTKEFSFEQRTKPNELILLQKLCVVAPDFKGGDYVRKR